MVKTTVRWLKDRHFVGTDSNNHSVVLSGQKDGIVVQHFHTPSPHYATREGLMNLNRFLQYLKFDWQLSLEFY